MLPNSDTYFSIAGPSEGQFKDQGSRFLALARPVESEDEVRSLLEAARREYHDARHHCVAFRIGRDGSVWRASDDGEPSGSAGRQILSQIDSAGLSDVAVIVVRWFGGIKLGIPGLIRAYREATAEAIAKAEKVQKISGRWVDAQFGYQDLPAVMNLVRELDLPVRNRVFGESCSLGIRVRDSLFDDFLEKTKNIPTFKY